MCFDTTSSNTGVRLGACTFIQKRLNRSLFFFACRHHIYELAISSAFTAALNEVSSGPDIQLFVRFKKSWPTIDKNSFLSGLETPRVLSLFSEDKIKENMMFAETQLNILNDGRSDYREVLYLIILFLGGTKYGDKIISVKKPGAVHRARWMAKIIYAIKIYLFRKQFLLKSE